MPRSRYSGMNRCAAVAEAEVERLADQEHPGPDIDEHAEFERAHPAREQDVGDIGQRGRDDTDEEHRAGEALHDSWSASPSFDLRRVHSAAKGVRAGNGGAFSEPVSAKLASRIVGPEA